MAIYAWLTSTLVRGNSILREQVALKQDRSIWRCLLVAFCVLASIPAVCTFSFNEHLWQRFYLAAPVSVPSIWTALYWVLVSDVLVRYCGMACKVGYFSPVHSY